MGNTFNSNPDEVMLAVSKGRIFEQAMPLLERIGITQSIAI